jgi:hypothetical protein
MQEVADSSFLDGPVAWMFENPKTGNVVFFDRALEAEKFSQWKPDWNVVVLYTKHASDMSEERVQISDKDRHGWGELTDVERHGRVARYATANRKGNK